MPQFFYITSSSYSGSTLLAFLLNNHPGIFTVSEMIGWDFREDEDFRCSCGEKLNDCKFYRYVAQAFEKNGLPFRFNDFGTAFRLSRNERLNRYLTGNLPLIDNSGLEKLRDALLFHLPGPAGKLQTQVKANRVFIEASLEYSGSRIFADASKNPYRLRFLSRIRELDIRVIYLVRDIRGVALSNMRNRGQSVRQAARAWIQDQHRILRVASEFAPVHTVYYEELCSDVDKVLAGIHRLAGLDPLPYPGSFKSREHHILGNVMRMRDLNRIVADEKWRRELSAVDQSAILAEAKSYLEHHPEGYAASVIGHYLGTAGAGGLA